jgi:hypothetical protein
LGTRHRVSMHWLTHHRFKMFGLALVKMTNRHVLLGGQIVRNSKTVILILVASTLAACRTIRAEAKAWMFEAKLWLSLAKKPSPGFLKDEKTYSIYPPVCGPWLFRLTG